MIDGREFQHRYSVMSSQAKFSTAKWVLGAIEYEAFESKAGSYLTRAQLRRLLERGVEHAETMVDGRPQPDPKQIRGQSPLF